MTRLQLDLMRQWVRAIAFEEAFYVHHDRAIYNGVEPELFEQLCKELTGDANVNNKNI